MTRLGSLGSLVLVCSCSVGDAPPVAAPALSGGERLPTAQVAEVALAGSGRSARVDGEGLHLAAGDGELGLELVGLGRRAALEPLRTGPLTGAPGRAELDHGPLREWWAETPRGLEQGFELADRPAGEGALTLALQVRGARLLGAADGSLVRLIDQDGTLWSYGELRAWDADRRALDASLVVDGERILLRVDDRGARYPLSVDPLMKTAALTWTGDAASDALGQAVAGRGDLNGDGYADLAIGAPGVSSSTGEVYVFYGSAAGISESADLTLSAPDASSAFGSALAMDGDVNADGYSDLVVGAPRDRISASAQGAVYVFHGSASGLSGSYSTRLTGSGTASAYFGSAVDLAGDVNGDGYDELLVGEYGYSSETGRAWIFAGSASGVSSTTYKTLAPSSTSGIRLGWAVSGGGDFNGDSYADFVIGAPLYYTAVPNQTGRVWIYQGGSSFFSGTPSTSNYTGNSGYRFGYAVSLEASYNSDSAADLVVAAPTGPSTGKGRVYYYQSTGTAMPIGATHTFDGPASGSYFGAGLSWAGDTDGDGDEELLVGAPYASTDAGYATLYGGGSSGLTSSTLIMSWSGASGETLGAVVTGLGDLNGDGYPDAALSATGYGSSAGQVTLRYGGVDLDGDGYVDNGTGLLEDCDDSNDGINPGASEACDDADADEDCDGLADDDDDSTDTSGMSTFYADLDDDGYGDPDSPRAACDQPAGHVEDDTDCDDGAAGINPGASEVCDEADVDEDCDGLADDDDGSVVGAGKTTFYVDDDADGYGGSDTVDACDQPAGTQTTSTDCDDGDGAINPGASEICDGADTDEDCDGLADDGDPSVVASGESTWYADDDSDGYGDVGATTRACDQPSGFVADDTDCDDDSDGVNPGATEICDASNTDEDCDGVADDADDSTAASGKETWYLDDDADGYGGPSSLERCDQPAGTEPTSTDCDDDSAAIHPGATEICDASNTDEDCDGLADDDDPSAASAGMSTYYLDEDDDGYGLASRSTAACDLPSGYATDATDCDDDRADVHPGASEVCDDADADEDCDGLADDADPDVDASGESTFYLDGDDDGYGDPARSSVACDAPDGYVAPGTDCDDADSRYHPDAAESCDDASDYNCDGSVDYADADADGWAACLECDDGDAGINPDADERCDDVDDDCDGETDEGSAVDATVWYADTDEDGRGDPGVRQSACEAPDGYVADALDCDDADAGSSPDLAEVCGDGADNDCDGAADGADADCPGDSGGDDSGGSDDSGASDDSGGSDDSGASDDSGEPDSGDQDDSGIGGQGGDDAPDTDGAPKDKDAGCSCASSGQRGGGLGLLLLALLVGRRRRLAS